MRKLVAVLSAVLVLMVVLACGLGPSPTATPRPSKPTATKAAAPKPTNTPQPKPTATPAPTPTGVPDVNFSVDRTQIKQGECVLFTWKVVNVKAVYFYQEGDRWQDKGVGGEDSRQVCPTASTTYYLRVAKPDDTVDLRQIAIAVEPAPTATSVFDPLGGTRWQVRSYYDPNSPSGLISVLGGTSLTVEFGRDGKLTGSAGCNTYVSTYVVQGSQLTVALPTATSKVCDQPQGIMEQETAFLAHLAAAGSFNLQGSRLSISNLSGQVVLDLISQ
jgi:hypothetical protein